jgi:hypothetical protein
MYRSQFNHKTVHGLAVNDSSRQSHKPKKLVHNHVYKQGEKACA